MRPYDRYDRCRRHAWSLAVLRTLAAAALVVVPAAADDVDRPIRFIERTIALGFGDPFELSIIDLDGDGDQDLVAPQAPHPHRRDDPRHEHEVVVFENNGEGRFRRQVVVRGGKQPLLRHLIGDVDGDGRPDLVFVGNVAAPVRWFRNPGPGRPWREFEITQSAESAHEGLLADVDGDGDRDLIVWDHARDHRLTWFENNGTPAQPDWTRHPLRGPVAECVPIGAADLDRDGDLDIVATAAHAGLVIWLENSGTPVSQPWRQHTLARVPGAMGGQLLDFDGDGDTDLVLAAGWLEPRDRVGAHRIVWLENPSGPDAPDANALSNFVLPGAETDLRSEWPLHVIEPRLPGAVDVRAGDIDGDGDLDLFAAAWADPGQIVWFENWNSHASPARPRGSAGFWFRQRLTTNWRNAHTVRLADLNGDGRLDVVAAAGPGSDELRWWENRPRDERERGMK